MPVLLNEESSATHPILFFIRILPVGKFAS